MSLAGGVMRPLEANKELMINDKFFLGGPLTLRGFNLKGVGPHSDGKYFFTFVQYCRWYDDC